jgi:8-oxo-dGTP pyrophosphatase MutT (NUDIX family)
MKHRVIVSALIRKGNQILMGKKPAGQGPYPDTWHIPGGGIELGEETCDEAIIREIKEETGLEVTNLQKIAWDTDVEPDKHSEETYYIFLEYSCDYVSGELSPDDDLQDLEWLDVDTLSTQKINRPSRVLFKKLNLL